MNQHRPTNRPTHTALRRCQLFWLAAALTAAGCAEPDGGTAPCELDGDCPEGICVEGVCHIVVHDSDTVLVQDAADDLIHDMVIDVLRDVDLDATLGEFLDPCQHDDECESGFCVGRFGEEFCTRRCNDRCPEEFECLTFQGAGPDAVRLCLPDSATLCEPCESNITCGNLADLCLRQDNGRFCASDCSDDRECPDGFGCNPHDADEDGGTTWACEPLSAECEPRFHDQNACDGFQVLEHAPGTTCGDCEDGEWACDGLDALVCVGASSLNTCGGCGALGGEVDTPCGRCGSGQLTCQDSLELACEGDLEEAAENSCGGCSTLDPAVGTACGPCLLDELICHPTDAEQTVCETPSKYGNLCGGCETLDHPPGETCGTCSLGETVCHETDVNATVCEDVLLCTPEAEVCDGDDNVQTCAGDGCSWAETMECDCACEEGQCVDSLCNPGAQRCEDGDVEECSENGCAWEFSDECDGGAECVEGDDDSAGCLCLPEQVQDCVGGDVYWFDSCGVQGALIDACQACETCEDAGDIATCDVSVVEDHQDCDEGDVYWFDSCAVRGARVEDCDVCQTCTDQGDTAICQTSVVEDHQDCAGGNVYWVDSCGVQGELVDDCQACETCNDWGEVATCESSDQAYQDCVGGDVYWFDSCGVQGALVETCQACETCEDAGETATCETSVEQDHQDCFDGDAYWFDSCGVRGARVDECQACETCSDLGATATCATATVQDHQDCVSGDVYWVDSCGVQGERADDCQACEICSDGGDVAQCLPATEQDHQDCSGGDVYWVDSCGTRGSRATDCSACQTCVDGGVSASCETATVQDHQACSNGNLYWYDSCDIRGGLIEACDCGCSGGSCDDQVCNSADVCCESDGCGYEGSSRVCQTDAQSEYLCSSGTDCGDDVYIRYRDRRCSGSSASCIGSYGSWKSPQVADFCNSNEVCEDGRTTCQDGRTTWYRDNDGDGRGDEDVSQESCGEPSGSWVTNNRDCNDGDYYIHYDHPEVWDVRDNNCDGAADNLGLRRYYRYHRAWSSSDWEHRFARSTPSGFLSDGHWVDLFPTDVCTNSAYKPLDRCVSMSGGKWISLWGGLTMVALAECKGVLGSHHMSLYLTEDSGEFAAYDGGGTLTCTRLGYVYGGSTGDLVSGAKRFHRHRSGFGAGQVGDNMWSVDSDEGHPLYNDHDPDWKARDGGQP